MPKILTAGIVSGVLTAISIGWPAGLHATQDRALAGYLLELGEVNR